MKSIKKAAEEILKQYNSAYDWLNRRDKSVEANLLLEGAFLASKSLIKELEISIVYDDLIGAFVLA